MLALIAILQTVLTFTTIAAGPLSDIDAPRQIVARTVDDWQALWKEHSPDAKPPSVDFTTSMVIGVFLGSRPTAGFGVAITAIRRDGGHVIVEYTERKPPAGMMVAQVITSPFHLVSVPRDMSAVEFRKSGR